MIEVTQIPETVLQKMTTKSLIATIHANGGVVYTIYNLDSSAKYFLEFE